ncbi:MAG: hypothetical protein ABIP48_25445 [Planctomycetota bacterium]
MMTSANEKERFAWVREHLYVPAVCDVLDDLGFRNQAMHQLIFADFDGIVAVPREVEEEAIARAAEKVEKETASRSGLFAGKSLREVYDRYGVL